MLPRRMLRAMLLAGCAAVIGLPSALLAQTGSGANLGGGLGGGGSASGLGTSSNLSGLNSGVAPNAALGGGLTNLRDLVDSPVLQPPTRAFTYQASLGVFAGYTDNMRLMGTGGGSSKGGGSTFERINPSIGGMLDLNRIQASANYAPSLQFYNADSHANTVSHSLSANAVATLVPDTVFVSANAFATQASTSQLSAYNGVNTTAGNNQTQTYSFSVNPYVVHQFGSLASVQAGYALSDSFFDNSRQSSFNNAGATAPNSNTGVQREYMNVTSGSDFEILNHAVKLDAEQFFGDNSRSTGHRNTADYTLTYAVNRFLAVLGTIGYEDLSYAATTYRGAQVSNPYAVRGLTGAGGVKFTPNNDSTLSVSYGHYDGGNQLSANGTLHATSRITLVANTSTGITTNGQDLANFAASTNFGPDGTGRSSTGAPVAYALGTSAANTAPYRLTRSSLNAIYALERDSFAASFTYSEQNNVTGNTTAIGASSTSTLGSVSWQHQASEDISLTASANYGQQHTAAYTGSASRNTPVVGGLVRLTNALTETLMLDVEYIYAHQQVFTALNTQNKVESMNEVLFGLTKRF
jgi:uncharacterized protein (PEP-CTERM system associated)